MSPDDLRHGTYAGSVAHWKAGQVCCDPCATAARRMRKSNALAALRGKPNTVELGDKATRIIRTTPRNQLVVATGMSHERLRRYEIAGPTRRVHRTTVERILNAGPTWTPIGLQRRLQALAALGWSAKALSDRSGIQATSLNCLRRRKTLKHVRIDFADRVLALYDDLEMTVAPTSQSASRTRTEAKRNGYLPPLAWDDIDDATEKPRLTEVRNGLKARIDHAVIERFLTGEHTIPTTQAEKHEIVRRWLAQGRPLAQLERIGWKPDRYINREEVA